MGLHYSSAAHACCGKTVGKFFLPGTASEELRNECAKKDVRAREAGEAATLARQNRVSWG